MCIISYAPSRKRRITGSQATSELWVFSMELSSFHPSDSKNSMAPGFLENFSALDFNKLKVMRNSWLWQQCWCRFKPAGVWDHVDWWMLGLHSVKPLKATICTLFTISFPFKSRHGMRCRVLLVPLMWPVILHSEWVISWNRTLSETCSLYSRSGHASYVNSDICLIL
jgi:hypothetical protein